MNMNSKDFVEKLKNKTLALFFTVGVSLKTWHNLGMIDREVALYNRLSKYFKRIYFFTYGNEEDLKFRSYLADNIMIIHKKRVSNRFLYSFMIPFIHHKVLKDVDILKTNQMWGSWSAVLTKIIFRRKMVIRTGYMLSIDLMKRDPKTRKRLLIMLIERIAYKLADGIITTSKSNFDYVEKNYRPSGVHFLIPNYVETDVFKFIDVTKKKGSICFVGRLTRQKNLFALLEGLKGLPYTIDIIGSGEQEKELREFANKNGIAANFLGNVPNRELPKILNQHELFIMPSLWEDMPKALLEAMACGLPVIGTNVKGINEVIKHGKNGILCNIDSNSIKEAIITLMEDEELRQKLGANARKAIVKNYSLDYLVEKELKLIRGLV